MIAGPAVLSAVGLLAFTPASGAARGLTTGFLDPLYASPDPATRQLWLDRTVQAGAGMVRLNVNWATIARTRPANAANPADPAYSFAALDAAVRDASARGLAPLLTVVVAPPWAEGPNRPGLSEAPQGSWRPGAGDYGLFAIALATRYGGSFPDPRGGGRLPRISLFQAWNEPNLSEYLTPQWRKRKPTGALIYRRLLNAFYAGIKSVRPDALVVTAGTAPYGDRPGGSRIRPVEFWRVLLCLREGRGRLKPIGCRKRKRARLDVLAHHPINTTGAPKSRALNRDDASSADMGRIRRVLRAAERYRTIRPRGHHPLWATEMWWETKPPDFRLGFPAAKQARFIEQTFYLVWKAGGTVALNLQIRDAPFNPSGPYQADQSGIFFANGSAKPAHTAFRFPFVTERLSRRSIRAWGKAPAAGRLSIEQWRGGSWRGLRSLPVGRGQVFATRLKLPRKRQLRATVAGETSLVWFQR